MSISTTFRCALVQGLCALNQTKSFVIQPEPLLRYVYSLNLPRTTERVFWYHYDRGYRSGNFETQIPMAAVSAYVQASISSIERAYDQLQQVGLMERISTRNPSNPLYKGVTITRICLPEGVLADLLKTPGRKQPQIKNTVDSTASSPKTLPHPSVTSDIPTVASCHQSLGTRMNNQQSPVLKQNDSTCLSTDQPLEAKPQFQQPEERSIEEKIKVLQDKMEVCNAQIKKNEPGADLEALLSHYGRLEIHLEKLQAQLRKTKSATTAEDRTKQKQPSHEQSGLAEAPEKLSDRVAITIVPNRITDKIRRYLESKLKELHWISDPVGLVKEVLFSIEQGVQKTRPPMRAANAALKLIRENRWRTPYGYSHA